jgi:hypothetical protein
MEILFEILAGIVQFIAQLIWELVLQTIFQVLFEAGLHGAKALFDTAREYSIWFAAIGYVILGVAAGGISLYFFPLLFVTTRVFQIASLVVTPILCGVLMSAVGSWRETRGLSRIRMETFAYGALFSLCFSLTRFLGAGH